MNWQDTIRFNLEEQTKLPHMGELNQTVVDMLNEQAKHSFYKGEEKGYQRGRKEGLKDAYISMQRRLQYIDENLDHTDEGMREFRKLCLGALRAHWSLQLKEWGVKED